MVEGHGGPSQELRASVKNGISMPTNGWFLYKLKFERSTLYIIKRIYIYIRIIPKDCCVMLKIMDDVRVFFPNFLSTKKEI